MTYEAGELVILNDFESTGLDEQIHEIIDVGVLLVHAQTLEVVDHDTFKVEPLRIELATPEALAVNGYSEEGWRDALPKKEAILRYQKFIGDVRDFASWNAWFDRRLLRALERETATMLPLDYHTSDIVFLAKEKLRSKLPRISLNTVAVHLGLEKEPDIHTGINGAHKALEVWRKLREL